MKKAPKITPRKKRRDTSFAATDDTTSARPAYIPPEAVYIGDENWVMPDALLVAQMIAINETLSERPDIFRRVDGGDDNTPPEQWTWERITKKRGRPTGSKNRAKAA
jgi:hypothetical protein